MLLNTYDVFGLGAITVDLIGSAPFWPVSGEKVKLLDFEIHDGGLTGTALATVSKLGGKAAICAQLGYSDWSLRAIKAFEQAGVNTLNIVRKEGCEPVISMIISNKEDQERNIFFSRKGVVYPMPEDFPDEKWYRHTRVLIIDHGSGEAGVKAAKLAVENGVQVIIDAERIEPYLEEMFDLCSHIVVSQKFAHMYSGLDRVEKILANMRKHDDQAIIITMGELGVAGLYNDEIFRIPGHSIQVVDTTGCGDVFHGAYALAIARGVHVKEAAKYANAAAALSATAMGGRKGIPTQMELEKFLSIHSG